MKEESRTSEGIDATDKYVMYRVLLNKLYVQIYIFCRSHDTTLFVFYCLQSEIFAVLSISFYFRWSAEKNCIY